MSVPLHKRALKRVCEGAGSSSTLEWVAIVLIDRMDLFNDSPKPFKAGNDAGVNGLNCVGIIGGMWSVRFAIQECHLLKLAETAMGRLWKSGRLPCRRGRANAAPVHDHAAVAVSQVAIAPIDTTPFGQMARAALDDR